MSTFRIAVPVFPSVSNLPKLFDETFSSLLVNGSITLIDASNFPTSLTLPLYATNSAILIPNIAAAKAVTAFGAVASDVTPYARFRDANSDNTIICEKTVRGGWHLLPVFTAASSGPRGMGISFVNAAGATAVFPTGTLRKYYMDVWVRPTRLPVLSTDTTAWRAIHRAGIINSVDYANAIAGTAAVASPWLQSIRTSDNILAGKSAETAQLLSAKFINNTMTVGTPEFYASAGTMTSTTETRRPRICANTLDGSYDGMSYILYGSYVEDLTLSGRTADQVATLRKADFDSAFTVGGRFYNDTWTIPA